MIDHALFPRDSAADAPIEVNFIAVRRFEGGEYKLAPKMYAAEDLPDVEALFDLYGGGRYRLEARAGGESGRQHWTKKIEFAVAGPSKPLFDTGGEDAGAIGGGGGAPPAPAIGGDHALLLAVMQMGQQQAAQTMQLMGSMMQSQTQLLAAVMGGQKGDQATILKAMADMSAADKANMAEFFRAFAQMKQGSGQGGELSAFLKGFEHAQNNAGPSGEDELASTLGAVVDGMRTAAELAGSGAIPPHPGGPIGATPQAPPARPGANGGGP